MCEESFEHLGNYVSTDYSYYNMNNCNQMQGILLVDVSAHSIYTCILYSVYILGLIIRI